jgi:hypothetical protein
MTSREIDELPDLNPRVIHNAFDYFASHTVNQQKVKKRKIKGFNSTEDNHFINLSSTN